MAIRELDKLIPSYAATEGAGVKIRRSLGVSPTLRHDPFLLLDEFYSDNPADYIAGFPSHPHRGFETVTYMLDGHMRHEDHLGNQGDLGPGDVQWMTAGRGIIHSEMPQQTEGRMHGFQLWINLAADEKMKPAFYRDIRSAEIPLAEMDNGIKVHVIAGTFGYRHGENQVTGPIEGLTTAPVFFDVSVPAGVEFETPVPPDHHVFLYIYDGTVRAGEQLAEIQPQVAALLTDGDAVRLESTQAPSRFLLVGGKPLNEPVVQYGPFVMNTSDEIERALEDYRNGQLTMPR